MRDWPLPALELARHSILLEPIMRCPLRLEGGVGVIAPGKQADLIVIERDLFSTPPHLIHAIQVDLTMLAGRVVFTRAGAEF